MTVLVLLILAAVWIAVLVPPWLQNRSVNRPADSIMSFRRQLNVLGRSSPDSGMAPISYLPPAVHNRLPSVNYGPSHYGPSRSELRRRRRDVFFTLLAATGLTFALAILIGGPVWYLQLLLDVLLGSYVALLARLQRVAMERTAKVRYLPSRQAAEPALLYRRSGT